MQTRVLKASWHADGSWPLIGFDEAQKHRDMCDPQWCVLPTLHESVHPHSAIIPNAAYEDAKRAGHVLPCGPLPPAAAAVTYTVEPDADAIAQAYAARRLQR